MEERRELHAERTPKTGGKFSWNLQLSADEPVVMRKLLEATPKAAERSR